MELENVQSRSSEIRENRNIRDIKGKPRVLGNVTNSSPKPGAYQVTASREDRDESNTFVTQERTSDGIPGEVIGQLIDENEKQLAYHLQQAEIIQNRLRELREIPDRLANINESE